MANWILKNKFNLTLIVILIGVFIYQNFSPKHDISQAEGVSNLAALHIYDHPDCPHCHEALDFLQRLQEEFPDLIIHRYNIEDESNRSAMIETAKRLKINHGKLRVPMIVINDEVIIGYDNDQTTGQKIRELLGLVPEMTEAKPTDMQYKFSLPLVGEVDAMGLTLPILAIVLGIIDGFNPCAMWVLAYMISLIVGLRDKARIYIIIGTFLLASGLLYFLFMTLWLNVFLLIGYVRILTLIIGLLALYLGISNIYNFIQSGGQLVCEVGDIKARQKRRESIKKLVTSPLTIATMLGIIALAFAINSIEFICSSALPAMFTHVLALSDLSPLQYYMYILLYVLFFMLDDLVIFLMAAFAVQHFAGEKYAGLCRIIGGVILIVIGIVLAFYPNLL